LPLSVKWKLVANAEYFDRLRSQEKLKIGIPIKQKTRPLPQLTPGQEITIKMAFSDSLPLYVEFDVMRPTGFSAYTHRWKA